MTPISNVAEVFEAIQQAKQGAAGFCTNFFADQGRLQGWIDHEELSGQLCGDVAFFRRRDRDFWHLYFCAPNPIALASELPRAQGLSTERVVVDLVGTEAAVASLSELHQAAGFRHYRSLCRLARMAEPAGSPALAPASGVARGLPADLDAVRELIESSFDRYTDQLPAVYEIEAALAAGQIYTVRAEGRLAALLFFETHGLTSVLRYWVVAPQFRSHHFGSALMRHYFADQAAVRRFILWVTLDNENALEKYRHYGYVPDSLVDHVLLNAMIKL